MKVADDKEKSLTDDPAMWKAGDIVLGIVVHQSAVRMTTKHADVSICWTVHGD